jgi:hypothetical protein
MVQALAGAFGASTRVIEGSASFLDGARLEPAVEAIITNPPYGFGGRLALRCIERSLEITKPIGGIVAMLLKVDYDSGGTRAHVFKNCPAWAKKLVLRRRIMWFPSQNGNGPSENHAWFIWDWKHAGPPTIDYAP